MQPPLIICQIVCMNHRNVIGSAGGMPWHIPEDLARFKKLTMGSALIMGRKTWASLPGVLPGRAHVVLSRSRPQHQPPEGVVWSNHLQEALAAASQLTTTEHIFIIGGGQIYAAAMAVTHRVYVTKIHLDVPGDVHYPSAALANFTEQEHTQVNLTAYTNHPSNPEEALAVKGAFIEYHRP